MKRKFRWGILGPGKIAAKFATALQYATGSPAFAVASRQGERARQFATQFNIPHYYGGYEELIINPEVDIVYIATPHAFHCEQALLCLRNGKAVLCEKPMALSHEQVEKMVLTARQADLFLMEGMWSRFMPVISKAKELIGSGVIGELQYVHADFGFSSPFDAQGRLYNRKLGGGSLLDVGVYTLFLTGFLLGEPTGIHATGRLSATGVDEYCNVLLQYPGGKTASVFSSITLRSSLEAAMVGTKGSIVIPAPWYKSTSLIVQYNDGGSENFTMPHECNGFEYEIREVTDCLSKGFKECPAMPLDFSLQLSKTMDTILEQVGVAYL